MLTQWQADYYKNIVELERGSSNYPFNPFTFFIIKKWAWNDYANLAKSSLTISLCKLYYQSLNVLPSFFFPSYPKSFSTAVGMTAEIYGWGRVEAGQKETSLRRGNYSMFPDFRYLPKWFSKRVCYNAHSLIKCSPVLYLAPLW